MNTQTLSLDLLRRLAIMQHLGEDYFIVNGIAYEGVYEDKKQEYDDYVIDFTEDETNEGKEHLTFAEWLQDECTEVEEFDTEDYNNDYLVLTDEEADEKWEESLDNYIEECIQPELDKLDSLGNLQYYVTFDEEKWKRDARMDGRGHSLSSYDGCENEETVLVSMETGLPLMSNDEAAQTFYIYRIN